ncbi:MAG: type II toxin-antitoxin system prevent-host-death family antitoxin [Spirochaetae bacterium HGW-Spirochaetae-1]|jgi:prevent-host-death family protein|nr:MAG: type II toxin-antitoxin system prevent-host-death family antitoxin [Spirochaetae bacterium HGW-Spirochaetae-1]
MQISAAEFKAKCLRIMDRVNMYHEEVVITKHGKPVAKLIPYSSKPGHTIFGYMKDTVTIHDDITKPIPETWDAEK